MQQTGAVPSRSGLRDRLASLLNDIAKIPMEKITDAATVDGDLQMQSITFVELQVAIEDEYQIQIDPIQVVELNRFDSIVDYIYDCIGNRSQ